MSSSELFVFEQVRAALQKSRVVNCIPELDVYDFGAAAPIKLNSCSEISIKL